MVLIFLKPLSYEQLLTRALSRSHRDTCLCFCRMKVSKDVGSTHVFSHVCHTKNPITQPFFTLFFVFFPKQIKESSNFIFILAKNYYFFDSKLHFTCLNYIFMLFYVLLFFCRIKIAFFLIKLTPFFFKFIFFFFSLFFSPVHADKKISIEHSSHRKFPFPWLCCLTCVLCVLFVRLHVKEES